MWGGCVENEGSREGPTGWSRALRLRFIRVPFHRNGATLEGRGRAAWGGRDERSAILDPGGSRTRAQWGGGGHGGEDIVMSSLSSRWEIG